MGGQGKGSSMNRGRKDLGEREWGDMGKTTSLGTEHGSTKPEKKVQGSGHQDLQKGAINLSPAVAPTARPAFP
ncbi:hypothetical protein DNTS_026706 [Danionella cerebrum]|uniref:Uncharacterized protein n=1 Tax=Danionella cerebrum TaxID=2873325 RepID=A0A553RKZ0_9TELE|nr:hypothetical protein DNTS_026706 [Danionella translucida]